MGKEQLGKANKVINVKKNSEFKILKFKKEIKKKKRTQNCKSPMQRQRQLITAIQNVTDSRKKKSQKFNQIS